MQILILSDIHANWYALEAVLADCEGQYGQIVCCGDLVGYNPHPVKVIEWTRRHCHSLVRGNHDKVVAGLEELDWFNETAQAAVRWTITQLEEEHLDYLAGIPAGPQTHRLFEIVHGSPNDEDEYITTIGEAAACFPSFDLSLLFLGHTHIQGGFFKKRGNVGLIAPVKKKEREAVLAMEMDTQYMVNPGSVGQPRDGDPRAAYALFDPGTRLITLRRVVYPVKQTSLDIHQAGLPDLLGARLFQGF